MLSSNLQMAIPVRNQAEQPLKEALLELENKYDVSLLFKDDLVRDKRVKKTIWHADNLEQSLRQVLQASGLTYKKVRDGIYYVIPKESSGEEKVQKTSSESLLRRSPRLYQVQHPDFNPPQSLPIAERKISGTVSDTQGQPIPGVNVVVKETTTGTLTDADGKYALNVPDDRNVLIFSFVGYISQEVALGSQNVINITLQESVDEMTRS
ncbi:MAG: hypothetical protein HC880_17050, partial [Bacteroidia bacterium]|nr:hypothetical protein [Bacteroidia bacterium]